MTTIPISEEDFITAYTPMVKRYATQCMFRFALSPEDVEDLISQSLMHLVRWYRRYPDLRDQKDVVGLISVAIKHAQSTYGKDKISKHSWIPRLELDAPYGGNNGNGFDPTFPDLPAPDKSPSRTVEMARSVLRRFSPEQQRLLSAFFGFYSGTPQTSVEMGITTERDKSAFFRLRQLFLQMCREELDVSKPRRRFQRQRKTFVSAGNNLRAFCNISTKEFYQLFVDKLTTPKTINEVYAEFLADGKQLSIHTMRSRVKTMEAEQLIRRVNVRVGHGHESVFIANKEKA